MNKKYVVRLTDAERQHLESLIAAGTTAARANTHARILLKADCSERGPAWGDEAIGQAFDVSLSTLERVRRLFVTAGLDAALYRKKAERHYRRKLDGEQEAHLVAITCSDPPEGQARWTLKLLAERMVELEVVDSVAPETVRLTLKKMNLSLG